MCIYRLLVSISGHSVQMCKELVLQGLVGLLKAVFTSSVKQYQTVSDSISTITIFGQLCVID